ncbi:MAG TPA: hypothetical protein VGW34_14760 [Allosphingosinicella sp.]|nr:hypothetical protein [Allosphingosinicella sp.]
MRLPIRAACVFVAFAVVTGLIPTSVTGPASAQMVPRAFVHGAISHIDSEISGMTSGDIAIPYQIDGKTFHRRIPRQALVEALTNAAMLGEISTDEIPGLVRAASRQSRLYLRELRQMRSDYGEYLGRLPADMNQEPREQRAERPPRAHRPPLRRDGRQLTNDQLRPRHARPQRRRREQARGPEDHPHPNGN